MVQLVSKNSLAKNRINIRKRIIDTGYIENIIAMLQNNLEKAYIIDLNEKIAQTICLPLVKIAQLVLVGNREKLRITTREIQNFGSIGRIDVPVNMAEEEIINKEEIISTHQPIFISLYDQYMLTIKKEVKDQAQLTIGTDKPGKLRLTSTDVTQDITQQFQKYLCQQKRI
ncbi:hypothetical protein G9A89_015776 [Geosiphon pyriformis]|nr:hypothetical protein G9A89_015776 [Geosiphon pyriformis]